MFQKLNILLSRPKPLRVLRLDSAAAFLKAPGCPQVAVETG